MQNTNCEEQAAAPLRLRHAPARLRRAMPLALALVAALIPLRAMAQMNTTTVQGTIYRADGTPASGTVLISWPAFTTAQNQAVAAGSLSTSIGANGFLSVNLTPNAGALPNGSYYTAVCHLSDGTVSQEYWVVPVAPTASVAAVRALLQPSTVAVAQSVTPAYVASAVASVSASFLPLSGGTLSGPLTLNSDPIASTQAATKHYADQIAAQSLPLSGGTIAGALNAQQLEGALYADQWQSGSGNNGILNSLQQCASLPYPCQVLAPALYSQAEQPLWAPVDYGYVGSAPQYGLPQSVTLLDQRFGGRYETVLNPYTSYPGTGSAFGGSGNVYAGDAHKVFYGLSASGAALNQNYKGQIFNCVHTQGGSLSQIYDNVNQSFLNCLNVVGNRSTSEAGFAYVANYQASSPGDAVLYGGNVLGPAGYNHAFDEGMELASQFVSETINVYRGAVAAVTGAQSVRIAPAGPTAGSGEVIAGTQGDGRYLLITSTGVTTLTPTAVTGYAGQTIGGAAYSYFSSLAAGAAVPVSTATGYLTAAVTAPYGSETVNFTANTGTLSTGIACMADQKNTGQFGQQPLGNFEEVNITAVGSGQFTAVFHKSHPVGGTYWQGGDCGKFIELVADTLPSGTAWSNGEGGGATTYPVRYPYPVLGSLDGAALIVFTASNEAKQNYASFGSAWQNSSTKTANLYNGAEVFSVAGANDDLSDNVFTLAPNNAGFASGQTVEESHFYAQSASTGKFSMSQWSPSGQLNGPDFAFFGRMEYPSAGVTAHNLNPSTSYTSGGGAWALPVGAFNAAGSWMYGFFWNSYATGQIYDLLGAFAPSAGSSIGLIGFNANPTPSTDQFTYTTPSGGNPSGGTWGFAGNVSVTGSIRAQKSITGATINGEITVDGVAYTSLNAAWNAAVTEANTASQNQTVRLGPGTFPVTATLTEPANGACVNLLGSGGVTMNADSPQIATTLTVPASLNGDVLYLGNAAQAQGCTFRDLNILAAGNATHGFELQRFRGLLLDNVAVNDTTAEGILLGEENTSAGHQASFLLRNVTVSYSSAAFTPASRPAYGIHLQKTAMDSHLDDIVVRNALTAAVFNEGTGNTGYLIHGFGYPYTCATAPCANNAASGSAANASYASSYVIYDTGGAGSVWTDTYADSPAIAGFYVGADGVEIHGGHIQWPDLTSFPSANLAYVASSVTNNLLIADIDCLEMASGVNWITYAGTAGNPPTYASVHHLTGCGNYYQSLEPANTSGFSSGGANIDDPSGAVPRVWSTPIAAASSYPAFSAQMYTGYQGDAFQAHFSGVTPFFNVTYQGTIRSNGGLALGTVINTASTLTLTAANKNVIANAAGGAQTLTLPSCYTPLPDNAAPTGLEFTIVKSDTSSNPVTLATTSSQLIYSQGTGAATLVLSSPSTQTLVCGPDYNWYVAGAAAATVSGSGVASFNGRTGTVVPQTSDYSSSYDALGAAATAQSNAEAWAANAANISSGKLPHAQLPTLLSADIPNNAASTTGNAATATALAATPAQCPTGYYATGIAASGAASCLQSWRFTWYGNFAGTFGTSANSSLGAIWSPTAAITMTRLDIAIGAAPAGCTTYPVIGIYDSTAATWLKTVTLAAATYSYRNAVTGVSIAAGHNLSMGVQTAGSGCSTSPGTAQLTMEYTMNQ
ncbi:MAG TPA: hypothetical protein VMD92_15230 [Acidobacteriaceae bacterium]|nr:hypothetical protein [Acidobacteriaceae bacterium]